MYIKPFAVEEWMNEWEVGARYNIAETCVDSVSLNELFALTGEDKAAFLENLAARRLTYGDIEGAPAFRQGICSLYKTVKPENIVTTHGAAGANHHVFCSLVSPGDRVISVLPTYQQLYSIPESLGAKVKILPLSRENGYLPDLDALRALAVPGTKMICINNPNNPTGALMSRDMLEEIVQIAREAGAYILCDEVYRHLSQTDEWSESIADLYEKGISVSSMSKVFSLAGLRLGWIATRDKDALRALVSHRDYDLISGGMIDEAIAALALKHSDKMLAAAAPSCGKISPFWTIGSPEKSTRATSSPSAARRRSSTTISTFPPMSCARRCTIRPVRSSRRATALSSRRVCASATPTARKRS